MEAVTVAITQDCSVEASGSSANIFLFGDIGQWYGYSETDLIRVLKNKSLDQINLYINSEGGSLKNSLVIYDLLRGSSVNVTAFLLGQCASAATIIACGANKVVMSKQCMYLVHRPMNGGGLYMTNADELRDVADHLDSWENVILDLYNRKTGLEEDDLRDLLSQDKWLEPSAALQMGFVDEIVDAISIDWQVESSGSEYFEWMTSIWNTIGENEHQMTGQTSYSTAVLNCVKQGYKGHSIQNTSKMSILDSIINTLAEAGLVSKDKKQMALTALSKADIVTGIVNDVKAQLQEGEETEETDVLTTEELVEALDNLSDDQIGVLKEKLGISEEEETEEEDETSEELAAIQNSIKALTDQIASMKTGKKVAKPTNGENDALNTDKDTPQKGEWKVSNLKYMLDAYAKGDVTADVFLKTTGMTVESAKERVA